MEEKKSIHIYVLNASIFYNTFLHFLTLILRINLFLSLLNNFFLLEFLLLLNTKRSHDIYKGPIVNIPSNMLSQASNVDSKQG